MTIVPNQLNGLNCGPIIRTVKITRTHRYVTDIACTRTVPWSENVAVTSIAGAPLPSYLAVLASVNCLTTIITAQPVTFTYVNIVQMR